MRLFFGLSLILTSVGFAATPAGATAPGVPCVRTTIVAKRTPIGPAEYQSGQLRLANGATLRLQGSSAELYRVEQMHVGDRVAACFGPRRVYADAGPARTITLLDLMTGAYYGTNVGNGTP